MPAPSGRHSASGVRISDDFRDNLIVDRYDACFLTMRESKKKHLRSENSEDALSWNVFRCLRQLSPESWLESLTNRAFGASSLSQAEATTIELWKDAPPPPSLLESGDEGISEIDIVLENPGWVWFIEAKYKSDISEGTTTRSDRDQILRNIDVGSYYAGVRDFYFCFLCLDEKQSPKGVNAIRKYEDSKILGTSLPHRTDGLGNIRGLGVLHWSDLAQVLKTAISGLNRNDEAIFAERAIKWMEQKGIAS